MKKYRLELVWNREFHWAPFSAGDGDNLENAISYAKELRDSGDGARVKKVRLVENETDKVVWNG